MLKCAAAVIPLNKSSENKYKRSQNWYAGDLAFLLQASWSAQVMQPSISQKFWMMVCYIDPMSIKLYGTVSEKNPLEYIF